MATAKITHSPTGTVIILVSGDFTREFHRDADKSAYIQQRAHDGSAVKRHPIDDKLWREVLEVAQRFAASENEIGRTLKSTWHIGR